MEIGARALRQLPMAMSTIGTRYGNHHNSNFATFNNVFSVTGSADQ